MPSQFYAVKGHQGGLDYFLTTLDFGDVANLVVLPEDVLGDDLLSADMTMQRKLNWTRVRKEMKTYLTSYEGAFFSALTLFMVPRDFQPLEEGEDFEFVPADKAGKHGQLLIRSSCFLFPGDGQHRAAAIKEALGDVPALAKAEIPVVLIPFRERGRVRQVFADLNLNAKLVNRSIGLAFETRDPLATLSKALSKSVALFRDGEEPRVNWRTNSLAATSRDVITMNALYEGTARIVRAVNVTEDLEKGQAASEADPTIQDVLTKVKPVWEVIIGCFPQWKDVNDGATTPGDIRTAFVFPHALGWLALANIAEVVIQQNPGDWKTELKRVITSVDWSRDNPDWQNVAMVGDRVNNTGPGIRATTGYVLSKAGITGALAESFIGAYKGSTQQTVGSKN